MRPMLAARKRAPLRDLPMSQRGHAAFTATSPRAATIPSEPVMECLMRDLPLPTFPIADLGGSTTSRRSVHRRVPPASGAVADAPRFDVVWARDEDEVRQAQQLRHLVFADEMGARLTVPHGSPAGHDIDLFDPFCEHLLVRAPGVDGEPGPVIGTYRVLTPANAKRVGGLYSDNEFDLTRLRPLRARMVELG